MALPDIKVRVGADTQEAEAGLERVQREMVDTGRAADRAASRTQQMSRAFQGVERRSAGMQRGIQNAAFQVGDFAVQVGAGQRASIALAQQLPQLLGGFGALGAVAGALVAIVVPLTSAMSGLAAEGEDVTRVFGTLQPLAQSIAAGMAALRESIGTAANVVVNNIDRILTIGATAVALFGVKWVAAMVAARVATLSLSGSLLFLRGALIRTGIGAVVVALGEAVFQFTRLSRAAGGFGEALSLIGDVAKESFDRIGISIKILKTNFQIVINEIQFAWVNGLGHMQIAFAKFLDGIAARAPAFMGLEGGNAAAAVGAVSDALDQIVDEQVALYETAGGLQQSLDAPFESIQKIRDLLASMKDDDITLGNILGVGDDDDGKGGKTLKEKLSDQEQAIKDHLDRIRGLTQGTLSGKLGAWGDYFNTLGNLVGTKNEKILKASKAFAAAQALIDAWVAHNKVLADPTLPWWARIASAVQVLGAGLGAVSAINSVSASGGGAGGAGASAAVGGAGAASAPQSPLNVRLSGISADELISGANLESLFDRLQDEAGDRGIRVAFA